MKVDAVSQFWSACKYPEFLTVSGTDMIQRLHTDKAPAAIGPYSQSVKHGDHLFVSGQLPLSNDGSMVEESFAAQVRTSLENLTVIVREAGFGATGRPFEIVKVTAYLADISKYPEFNDVYSEFFGENQPARAVVGVASLPKNAPVEIECIAMS